VAPLVHAQSDTVHADARQFLDLGMGLGRIRFRAFMGHDHQRNIAIVLAVVGFVLDDRGDRDAMPSQDACDLGQDPWLICDDESEVVASCCLMIGDHLLKFLTVSFPSHADYPLDVARIIYQLFGIVTPERETKSEVDLVQVDCFSDFKEGRYSRNVD